MPGGQKRSTEKGKKELIGDSVVNSKSNEYREMEGEEEQHTTMNKRSYLAGK